ncbi:MAG: hypothetical protein SRB1_02169 [Desulfobacteraceae bacterium Eth-SRB1]|nr:MAG: hypothetical protein SRB1_02169 [Desulfobacteraceae bacterium Eth-SRB1]
MIKFYTGAALDKNRLFEKYSLRPSSISGLRFFQEGDIFIIAHSLSSQSNIYDLYHKNFIMSPESS